jgi:AcrR family transcriptional regulator
MRDDLVAAGTELLESGGLASLSLRRIARAAGVTHGAPRYHFPTYESLLAAIARRGIEDLGADLGPCLAEPDPRDAVRRAARAYYAFAVRRPEMFELIVRHDLLNSAGANLREVTVPWFTALQAALARTDGDEDPTRALALWAGVHGIAVLAARRTTEPIHDGRLDAEAALAYLLDALLPAPAGTPR